MKKNIIILILLLAITLFVARIGLATDTTKAAPAEPATSEEINWQVISSGGTDATSTNLWLRGTVGQTAVGTAGSGSFNLSHGFWYATCCNHDGIRGDVNYNFTGPNIADLTYLVDFLFRGGPSPPCDEEGDVNADGNVNIADLTYLVDFQFRGGPPPVACP